MARLRVTLAPIRTPRPVDCDLAAGIRRVWACTLFATGVEVGSPIASRRDRARWSVGAEGHAIVLGELTRLRRGWCLAVGVVGVPGRGAAPVRASATGALDDVMTRVLRALAGALDLALPHDLAWLDLLRRRDRVHALADLRILGARPRAALSRLHDPTP